MDKIVIKFGDIEIEQQKLHEYERPISMKNVDINEIVVSNKASFGKKVFKYFTGYKDAKKIIPSCIFLQKVIACKKDFYLNGIKVWDFF